jgi:hypothetical protein
MIDSMIDRDIGLEIALTDKDDPGGICLTRGCIPSKMLLYPAELIRLIMHIHPALSEGVEKAFQSLIPCPLPSCPGGKRMSPAGGGIKP